MSEAGKGHAMPQDSQAPEDGLLTFREKTGYALGDAASNFYWKTFEFFIIFFYTDVFGISAGAVGTMLLVTRILDAVADPLIGAVADHGRLAIFLYEIGHDGDLILR